MDPKTETTTPEAPADDLRSALESAIETHAEEPEGEASPPAPDADIAPPAEDAPPAPAPEPPPAPAEATAPPVTEPAPQPEASPDTKAPGTWTPGAREKWQTLPTEVKQEVWKREREASRALTISADARRAQADFERTIQPFLGFIAAERSTPLQAVTNMMQTAALYRVGTPQQKVEVTAQIIRQFGVDLRALDAALAGQAPEFNPQIAVQQQIDEAIRPFREQATQLQQQREQQLDQQIDAELNVFTSDPKHEFYEDVKGLMADLIEVAHRRGEQMGLTAAYERAILIHEPVRRVVEARKQAEITRQQTQRARQARGAASSVTPSSEVARLPADPGDSIRQAIESAMAKTEGR